MIRKNLGNIISREISDPGMGLVSITEVEVSQDLKTSNVYFTVIGGTKDAEKQKNIVRGMSKFFQQKLAEKIRLKYTPEINIIYDDTPVKAQRIESILEKIRRERKMKSEE